jgi:hypothetical protein
MLKGTISGDATPNNQGAPQSDSPLFSMPVTGTLQPRRTRRGEAATESGVIFDTAAGTGTAAGTTAQNWSVGTGGTLAINGAISAAAIGTLFIADTGNHTLRAGRPAQAVAIITQPRGQTVQSGDPVEFTVTATGWPRPLTCQWYRNGDLIPAATAATLKLGAATDADAGDTCTVVVGNPLGSVPGIGAPALPLLLALALLLAIKTTRKPNH